LVSIEVDPQSAEKLRRRMAGTNVEVVDGDATDLAFDDETFSGAVCFTMLHHVPSEQLQDRLLREAHRVLQADGTFAGSDSRPSLQFRAAHLFDTMVLVDPDDFGSRLERAGFEEVEVRSATGAFRFRGRKV
jgi:ubiquinone/menaquinone biosynthesis C-methylase UbiE